MPPHRLALFPLSVVLFPGTPLPLHIFEPRYRQMLADCMAGNERFGIVGPGADGGDPSPGAVGCIAHVRASQQLPDGRSNIVVVGESRFILRALAQGEELYLQGLVEEFGDLPGTEPDAEVLQQLSGFASRYREALGMLADQQVGESEWDGDPAAFSFQVAALLDLDAQLKQELLALRSTETRVRRLLSLLPPLTRDASERATVHVRARTNGQGGHHYDVVTDE